MGTSCQRAACLFTRIRTAHRSILAVVLFTIDHKEASLYIDLTMSVCVVSLLLSALLKFHFNCGSSTTPLSPLDLLPLLHVPCQLLHVVSTCTCCHLFVTKELRTFVSCKVHLRTYYVCRQVWGGGE